MRIAFLQTNLASWPAAVHCPEESASRPRHEKASVVRQPGARRIGFVWESKASARSSSGVIRLTSKDNLCDPTRSQAKSVNARTLSRSMPVRRDADRSFVLPDKTKDGAGDSS